jgi:hypothetical protein
VSVPFPEKTPVEKCFQFVLHLYDQSPKCRNELSRLITAEPHLFIPYHSLDPTRLISGSAFSYKAISVRMDRQQDPWQCIRRDAEILRLLWGNED